MMNAPVLEVSGVRRDFGEGRGLDGVDLRIGPGEIYGLLGPNGAGKTSLVRAISGRLRLDAGSVRLDGRDPRREPLARRNLGLVPQELALYPDLTIQENLVLLGQMAGLSRAAARRAAPEALSWIELEDRARSRIDTLSGGQKRRVNLAASTLHQPRLLLLDEPTVGVDVPARERIHRLLADLRSRGMALLLATHDLEQAATLCDRIGILVAGRLRAEGTVEGLVRASFGVARELTVTLRAEPTAEGREALAREGLTGGADARVWSGPIQGGVELVPAVVRRLEQVGLAAAETRLREPGLRGVFFRVAGREMPE